MPLETGARLHQSSVVSRQSSVPTDDFGLETGLESDDYESMPLTTGTRRWADTMLDGDRIIGVMPITPTQGTQVAQEIAIVLNWFDEVRRRVPAK